MTTNNIVWHQHNLSKQERATQKQQRPCILWFTGLSGAGKSTIANAVEQQLFQFGHHSYLLDGDNVRHGINRDLGFSDHDRVENIRRIGEVSKLFCDAGLLVLTAFISPFRSDRDLVRSLVAPDEFIEVFIDTPLAECERRDPKGLYEKARSGEIKNFTGIDSEYQAPKQAEVIINAGEYSIDDCAKQIIDYLIINNIIHKNSK